MEYELVLTYHSRFLLPALHVKMILGMPTKYHRRKALNVTPTDLYDSFQGVVTRIRKHPGSALANLGIQTLMWLHFAYRPLKLVELQHALAVTKSHTEFDRDNIPPLKVLLDCCLGLVVVDEETSTVHFMHYTLDEYFRENSRAEFPNGCSSIAEICLTYLNFGELRQHCTDDKSLEKIINKYAFLDYAALHWGNYIRQLGNDSLLRLTRMLVEHVSEKPPCAIQALYKHLSPRGSIARKFSGIHTAAYFGLSEIMANFVQVELRDESGRTPLSWAAEYGHESVVRLLIERDSVDINSKDGFGQAPLSMAAENGHEAVVRLLIERDSVDIDARDGDRKTPLFIASENGHEAVVRLLIESDGVDINARDVDGKTPLFIASENGHEAVVRLLIERDDIDINSKDGFGHAPLFMAAENGHEAVVRLLIERDDVDMNAKDDSGKTPLSIAVENGHEVVVRLLICKEDVDVHVKDNNGRTPLLMAAENGHEAIVQLLRDRGVRLPAEDA